MSRPCSVCECLQLLLRDLGMLVELAQGVGSGPGHIHLAALPARDRLGPDPEHVGDLVGAEPGDLAHELELLAAANAARDDRGCGLAFLTFDLLPIKQDLTTRPAALTTRDDLDAQHLDSALPRAKRVGLVAAGASHGGNLHHRAQNTVTMTTSASRATITVSSSPSRSAPPSTRQLSRSDCRVAVVASSRAFSTSRLLAPRSVIRIRACCVYRTRPSRTKRLISASAFPSPTSAA